MNTSTIETQATKEAKAFAKAEATRNANAIKAEAIAKAEAETLAQATQEAKTEATQRIILSNGTDTKTFVFDDVAKSFTDLEKKLVVKYDKDGNIVSAYAHLEKVFTAKVADNNLRDLTDAINAHNSTIAARKGSKSKKSKNQSVSDIAYTVPQVAIDFENLMSSPTRIITTTKEIEDKKSEIKALEASLKELEALKATLDSMTAEELETMEATAAEATERAKAEAAEKIKADRLFNKTASNIEELSKEQARKMLEKLTAMLKA